jgi:hypothetical protein
MALAGDRDIYRKLIFPYESLKMHDNGTRFMAVLLKLERPTICQADQELTRHARRRDRYMPAIQPSD